MAITAYDPSAELSAFIPDAPGSREGSRIVGLAIFKTGFDVSDLTADAESWETGITAKDIVIVKPVAGNMTRPTDNTIPGKGFLEQEITSRSYDVPVTHYGVDANLALWNTLNQSNDNYSVGFVFEDFKMYVALDRDLNLIPMSIAGAPESEETLGNKRQVSANIRWKTSDLPHSVAVPSSLFR